MTFAFACREAARPARRARFGTASPAPSWNPIPSYASRSSAKASSSRRDARKVERKKAGLHKASQGPQFSKR